MVNTNDIKINTESINLLNLNGIYFQKLFILRGKSHWRGIAGTKKPSLGGLLTMKIRIININPRFALVGKHLTTIWDRKGRL